ncbi:MAG: DUF4349 domain-containing protein [Eubacteriales bacterium]|nr:DUF4349 domain-containing protein [Eubacteriales bacterium]
MKKLLAILLASIMLFALCACDRRSDYRDSFENSGSYAVPAMAPKLAYSEEAVAAGSYGGFSANAVMSDYAEYDAVKTESSSVSQEKDTSSDLDPEKIIYSANATVETTEFEKTVSALNALIEKLGGWVESSSVSGANYSNISRGSKTTRSADYTIRVPNGEFENLMSELSSLGNVPYSHVYTENVTAEYYDTQARLKTYEAQEKRLLELLDEAESVSDVIEIENELTEVRYRIESLQTSLRGWDRRVSWSTLNLTVNEVFEYTPQEKRSYGSKLAESFSDGIELLGDFFLDLVEALPVLLLLLAILIVVILVIKKIIVSASGRRAERRAKRAEKKSEAVKIAENTEKKENRGH